MKNEEIMRGPVGRLSNLRPLKNIEKHWLEQLLRAANFAFEQPYKATGKLMNSEPNRKKGLESIKNH